MSARKRLKTANGVGVASSSSGDAISSKVVEKVAEKQKPEENGKTASKPEAATIGVKRTPTARMPTVKTPTLKTPTVKTPTMKTPTVKTPTVNTPTVKTPTLKTPTTLKTAKGIKLEIAKAKEIPLSVATGTEDDEDDEDEDEYEEEEEKSSSEDEDEEDEVVSKDDAIYVYVNGLVYPKNFPIYLRAYIENDRRMLEEELEETLLFRVRIQGLY
jgi:hypothetical protein